MNQSLTEYFDKRHADIMHRLTAANIARYAALNAPTPWQAQAAHQTADRMVERARVALREARTVAEYDQARQWMANASGEIARWQERLKGAQR